MRLMFILNTIVPLGGAEVHAFGVANGLGLHGDICRMVGLRTVDIPFSSAPTGSVTSFNGNKLYNIDTMCRLAGLIRSEQPEILVAINDRPLLFGALSRRLAGSSAKLVYIDHGSPLHNPPASDSLKARVLNMLYRPFVAHADLVVYVSKGQCRLWEERGFKPDNATVIHNGVDTERFSPNVTRNWREQARANLGFRPEDYVVGMCALFRSEKNHYQLIDAVQVLRNRGHRVKALLVGGGPLEASIKEYVATRGLLEHVVFAGIQQDVRPYISAFDVGVLCSTWENLPIAALEIMAMGVPVVLSNVWGTAELVQPDRTGFLFPVGDTEALASYLEILSQSPKRQKLGRAASRSVAARFAVDRMLARYRESFVALLRGNQEPKALGNVECNSEAAPR